MILNRFFSTFVITFLFIPQLFSSDHVVSVFTEPDQRSAIASFIDSVLRQLPSEKIIELVDEIMLEQDLNDQELYEKLSKKIEPLRSRLDILRVIKLIRFQQQLLEKQITALLGEHYVGNCLEIGTPGTYSSTIRDRISGKIYALLDKPAITDVVQAYSLNPAHSFKGYQEFVPFNNYDPISQEVPDNSIDLIICTIGLHHVPPHKLDAFIDSLKRVLAPGGIFLLREHNAHSPQLVSLAFAAHSIFNVMIPQESLETELKEVRNFHALAYWKNLLQAHGFVIGAEEYLQEGDSTLNTFIKYTKKCETFNDYKISATQRANKYPDYARDGVQKYLTTPEWNNVDAAQQYSQFINTVPFYEFPYMAHVKTFWKTFYNSWRCAAEEKGGNIKLFLSPNLLFNYTLMNIFIGAFMTVEYSAKAIVSWPIRMMLSGVEATTLLALVHDPKNEIAHVDPTIKIVEQYDGALKLVSIPRYVQFLASVKKLIKSSVTFIKIAGNETILCKIRHKNTPSSLKATWVEKFTWQMPTVPEYIYAAYAVPVSDLKEFIDTLEQQHGELLYIHDF